MHRPRIPLLLLLLLLCGVIAPGGAVAGPQASRGGGQYPSIQEADPQLGTQRQQQKDPDDPFDTPRMKRMLIKSRYDALKKDTDKLLVLATELKTYVDQTNENTLSLEVVRKAEEIEKLAHSVKEKMKGM